MMSSKPANSLRIGAVAMFAHHLDHLVPLCELLGATLFTLNEEMAEIARECYPYGRVTALSARENSLEKLAASHDLGAMLDGFDVLLYSHLLSRRKLYDILGDRKREPPRVIFCPHGFSEKNQRWSAGSAYQDISLFYGGLALQQLEHWGVRDKLQHFALIGNLRLEYYHRHRVFFDSMLHSRGVLLDQAEKVILYAPTWKDNVGSSSFQDALLPIIDSFPAEWHLLIKPHPLLEIEAKTVLNDDIQNRKNVTFLERTPVTYPVLALSDVYVGDMSALAYDYLFFDRPMVFLNQTSGTSQDASASRLFTCGPVLSPGQYSQIPEYIASAIQENKLWSSKKWCLYRDVYSASKEPGLLTGELLRLCAGPAPPWMKDAHLAELDS